MWDRFGFQFLFMNLALFGKKDYSYLRNFGVQFNPIPTSGQIMPTTLLLAQPDLTRDTIKNDYEY